MKIDKLRVGVIGVGHLGEYHVQKYRNIPMVDLVGIVDANPERADMIGQSYDARIFQGHKDLLKEVDAVSLVVPTTVHYEVAKDVLAQGVHLLIEKPITYKLEPANTLVAMAQEKNLVLQVGLVERFNPAVVKMESILDRPVFIEAQRMNKFTLRGTDADVVLDLMIHDLDIILHIVNSEIKELRAVGMSVTTDKTDIANARIIFENGTVATLTASRVSDKTIRKTRIFQPDCYMEVDFFKRKLSIARLGDVAGDPLKLAQIKAENETFPDSDPLEDEIKSFVYAVNNGREPVVSGHDGRKALKVSLDIIELIKKGSKNF
jgi:predicted dehydrogenase